MQVSVYLRTNKHSTLKMPYMIYNYRPEIDGLRAVAVLAVIANHLNSVILPGGYLGVDIFFVISGYVITSSLQNGANASLGRLLIDFYSRRIKRLAPALITIVIFFSVLIRLFVPDTKAYALTGVSSLFGISNIFLYTQAIDYFGQSAKTNPFTHTWSLGVEEQFYLIFPLLFMWRAGQSNSNQKLRLIVLSGLSLASLLAYVITYYIDQPAAYFLMPFRFWELGVGCILAFGTKHFNQFFIPFFQKINPARPSFFILVGLCIPEQYTVFATVFVVLSTVALIGSLKPQSFTFRILTYPAVVYMGLISYSLYLWHWCIICLSRWTIGIYAWSMPFQLILIFVLAIVSYHFIEKPLRKADWFNQKLMTIAIGLAGFVAASAVILLTQRFGFPQFSGVYDKNEIGYISPMPGYKAKYSGREIDKCFAHTIFSTNTEGHAGNITRCLAINGSTTLLTFVGDSHAMDLFPMADKIYNTGEASVLNIFSPGCRVPPTPDEDVSCAFITSLIKYLSENRSERLVLVIRSNYSPKFADGTLSSYSKVLERFLNENVPKNLNIVYFAPSPKYNAIGPGSYCSRQWFRPEWAISDKCKNGFAENRNEQLARRKDFFDYLRNLEKTHSNFYVYDPFDVLCGSTSKFCSPLREGGRLIYRDSSHLTEEGSELLSKPFQEFLEKHKLL